MKPTAEPKVTFEFHAFPARRWPYGRKRWHFGMWSTFACTTLAQAKAEIRRLRRIYAQADRGLPRSEQIEARHSAMGIFEITRVTREKVPG